MRVASVLVTCALLLAGCDQFPAEPPLAVVSPDAAVTEGGLDANDAGDERDAPEDEGGGTAGAGGHGGAGGSAGDGGEAGAGGRVTDGLIALYPFDEAAGSIVHDRSGYSDALDLEIEDPSAVTWIPGGLIVAAPNRLRSKSPATKINVACRFSNEITVEAWLRSGDVDYVGVAAFVALDDGVDQVNFGGAQVKTGSSTASRYEFALRTTTTSQSGTPSVGTEDGVVKDALQHLVYARASSGSVRIHLDGVLISTGEAAGDLSSWSLPFRLPVANANAGSRPWAGVLRLIAIYERSLTEAEVLRNFDSGPDES